jgi:hypothetical protein
MRHRISVLLAAALAGTALVLLGPAQPAGAVLVCSGTGTVTVNPGLLVPVLGGITGAGKDHVVDILIGDHNTTHGFVFQFDGCVHLPNPTIFRAVGAGTVKGYCGHSRGMGTLNGQPFSWIESGAGIVLTGHVIGKGYLIPAPGTGPCPHFEPVTPLPSGATEFILTLEAIGLNCSNALPPQELLVRLVDQDVLVVEPLTGLSVLGIHVHFGFHTWTMPPCTSPDVLL